jgi:hypothetical protein
VRYVPFVISCLLIAATLTWWGALFCMDAPLITHVMMLVALGAFGVSVKAAIDFARYW